jgi:hypothetical protein
MAARCSRLSPGVGRRYRPFFALAVANWITSRIDRDPSDVSWPHALGRMTGG